MTPISRQELEQLRTHGAGVCRECHCWTYGVSPGDEHFPCDNCGKQTVMGPEALLQVGLVQPDDRP